MKNKKNILVTGGSGYIGSHICVSLFEHGYNPIIVDDLSNSYEDILDGIKFISGFKPDFFEFNLCDEASLKGLFEKIGISGVIHLAAHKAVEESVYNPIKYYQNNLLSLINLLSVMKDFNVNNLVYSSSAAVYAPSQNGFVKETDPTSPVNPYGWTKLMGEQMIADASRGTELRAGILRYFNPVGAHPSGKIGENPKSNTNNLMSSLGEVLKGRKKEIVVYGDDYNTPDGTAMRDYVHVCDVADAHVAVLNKIFSERNSFTLNIGTGHGVSVKEILSAYEQVSGIQIPKSFGVRRAGDLGHVCADTSLATKTLGWTSSKTIQDMCKDFHRWIVKQS